jgi:hypothetical protein
LASLQALRPRRGDRPRLAIALLLQAPLGLTQPVAAAQRTRKLRRQLVAAALAELLVLSGVDLGGLLKDLLGQVLVVDVGVLRRVGMDLGAVDGQHLDPDQAGLRAQPQDLAEQVGQRALVALTVRAIVV